MGIPRWRVALTGAAIVILAIAGIGIVSGGSTVGLNVADNVADVAAGAATSNGEEQALDAALDAAPAAVRDGARTGKDAGPLGRWGLRHLVHAVVTIEGKDGDLYTIQLDRGTVTAVDGDSLTISEAGGSSVTVALNSDTKVREGRERSNLDAIDVGDEVFVQSRIDGSTLAKRIVIIPAS
jgi:hypothetical protein